MTYDEKFDLLKHNIDKAIRETREETGAGPDLTVAALGYATAEAFLEFESVELRSSVLGMYQEQLLNHVMNPD